MNKPPSGSWRVLVRRKGKYASEAKIERSEPIVLDATSTMTFGGLIDLHKNNIAQVYEAYGDRL